ncbi:glycosyltransferase [uncultured Thiohalocapsa sp.]|uniref:glycosyltransferase family 32 protein n=1 Tax=uncultured Thiohalocapsa sp. TaxID=768990 RepID=UPI0025E63950|nr:glycosyltransferase [uncultured Thiohalocapsa sp.]
MMIPRVIHQTWKDDRLPPQYATLADTWRRAHPEWAWRLWTDADNLRLVEQEFPSLLGLYLDYPYPIQRVDLIRYLILYRYGGLYVDLDFECFKDITPLLDGRHCVLSEEAAVHNAVHCTHRIISNAFMAAEPGHLLFAAVMEDLQHHRSRQRVPDRIVLDTTGPMMLTRVVERLGADAQVTVLNAANLFPLSMGEADRLRSTAPGSAPNSAPSAAIRARLNQAYGMHWHDGSWWRPNPGAPVVRPPRWRLDGVRRWMAAITGSGSR